MSDHTLVTNAYGIALMWAVALACSIDTGEHPNPLARVVAHRSDPAEVDPEDSEVVDEDEEKVLAFVSPDEIFTIDEDAGKALAAETFEFSEIMKRLG